MVKTETIIKGLASPEGIPLGGKGICFSLPVPVRSAGRLTERIYLYSAKNREPYAWVETDTQTGRLLRFARENPGDLMAGEEEKTLLKWLNERKSSGKVRETSVESLLEAYEALRAMDPENMEEKKAWADQYLDAFAAGTCPEERQAYVMLSPDFFRYLRAMSLSV